jgi:putative Mg2+ transporter-C (MgtC) family protein
LIVGLNRDLRNRPIGMRTLSLVALGSAIVVVSTIQFPGIVENSNGASRVVQGLIQGLMAGIGFIGAGVILRDSNAQRVKGLTSAATVWVRTRCETIESERVKERRNRIRILIPMAEAFDILRR